MHRAIPASFVFTALVFITGCSSPASDRPAAPAQTTTSVPDPNTVAVQRDILGSEVDPPGAPGHTLTLIRYTIAPTAKLAPHIHPGVQMASIQSGSLTYTVETGTATVRRGAGAAAEEVTGPATTTLNPGDVVTEKGDMVHFGANDTGTPVVILATLLTESGRDLAIPVTTVPASTPG